VPLVLALPLPHLQQSDQAPKIKVSLNASRRSCLGRLWITCPPLDAAADTPEKLRLLRRCPKWKKVMDDFLHGQFAEDLPVQRLTFGSYA
jgi:hypothetical protein